MNFMESCLHAFHTHTDWSTSNYFSLLNSKSQEILDFLPPNQPFTLSVAKNVSFNLKSSFNLTLPSSHAVSFLYSSHDIQPGCRIFQPASTIKPLLLYGKLYQDGRLEALSSYRLHPHVQLVTTGLSTLGEKSQVHINTQLHYAKDAIGAELNFSANDRLLGLRGLMHLSRQWSCGGELYYTAVGKSGGLSAALQYRPNYPTTGDLTLSLNPMMGHISTSYTTTVAKDVQASTRYDFNIYSFDSNLVFGISYAPEQKGQKVKFRIGGSQGLALVWESNLDDRWRISFGAMTEITPNPRKCLGIDIQYIN